MIICVQYILQFKYICIFINMNTDIIQNTYSFFVLNQFLNLILHKKQSANVVSGIHALCSTILSSMGDIKHVRTFSSAYFLYDLLQVTFFEKNKVMKYVYIYHHLLSIFLLTRDSRQYPTQELIFWGEISNLPSYPLYYFIHANPNGALVPFFRTMQKILYTGIRIPILTNIMIKFYKDNDITTILPFLPMYFIGIFWSFRIVSQ